MEGIQLLFIYLFLFFSIMLDAYSDAFIDNTGKREHKIEVLSILMLMVAFVMFTGNDVLLILQYVIMRAAYFNIIYNKQRNLKLMFLGSTDMYDRFWKKFPKWFYILFIVSIAALSILTVIIYVLNR